MFKITISCQQIDDEDDGGLLWEAKVDRFPDVRGYDKLNPIEAVTVAAEAAAILWFNRQAVPTDAPK